MPRATQPLLQLELLELYRQLTADQQVLLVGILEERIEGKLSASEFIDRLRQIPEQVI